MRLFIGIWIGILLFGGGWIQTAHAQATTAQNPIIYADVPDMSMVRVGNTYYMSSTTMHMNPGVPIMKSEDLVNWKLVNYAYQELGSSEALDLENGKSAYGRGSWASCIRYVNGVFYVSTFSQTTGTTYIYSTKDIEGGQWEMKSFKPSYHDHTIFFDDDGKIYMIWGAGKLKLVELKQDLSGTIEGTEKVLMENASAPAGENIGLRAEGSQLFKIDGKYFLVNITWPRGGMRTVLVHRADQITGPYEGKLVLQDKGVAQGGFIDTPEGEWYAYLFRDYGAVGRIPYLVPMTWEEGWPVLGIEGKVPEQLDLPSAKGLIPGIVVSDEFTRKKNDPALPLVWQWNHNPVNELWSVTERKGFLRLKTDRTDQNLMTARNTLTQRTIGPDCTGITSLNVAGMKEGDFAGLTLVAEKYGQVGVKFENGVKSIVMLNAGLDTPIEVAQVPLDQDYVYLKAVCDFRDLRDIGTFYYSLDGETWMMIGSELKMVYTLGHFMGYRFGLYYYSTQSPGGFVDFDYLRISSSEYTNSGSPKSRKTSVK